RFKQSVALQDQTGRKSCRANVPYVRTGFDNRLELRGRLGIAGNTLYLDAGFSGKIIIEGYTVALRKRPSRIRNNEGLICPCFAIDHGQCQCCCSPHKQGASANFKRRSFHFYPLLSFDERLFSVELAAPDFPDMRLASPPV